MGKIDDKVRVLVQAIRSRKPDIHTHGGQYFMTEDSAVSAIKSALHTELKGLYDSIEVAQVLRENPNKTWEEIDETISQKYQERLNELFEIERKGI